MKKYELIPAIGKNRIIALRNFGLVKKGDSGGFIASEANLSHDGLCWVDDNARVYGDAHVSENARVYGNALVGVDALVYGAAHVYGAVHVYGAAHVYGSAHVYGAAHVYGSAEIYGNARVFGDARGFGSAEVGGTLHVGGQSIIVDNETFCSCHLGLPSLKEATRPANKDRLLRALLIIYKKNPEWWSVQIGLFIDELHQQGVRYPELLSIKKSAASIQTAPRVV